jgi:hypothetical protein
MLHSTELACIYSEGSSWIVEFWTINGKNERVFADMDLAYKFFNLI